MTKSMQLALTATVATLTLGGLPARSLAQDGPGNKDVPSLEFNQADVREALRALFKNVGVSYSIAPEVQGTITCDLKHVPFETALQNILSQVDATYRIE